MQKSTVEMQRREHIFKEIRKSKNKLENKKIFIKLNMSTTRKSKVKQ